MVIKKKVHLHVYQCRESWPFTEVHFLLCPIVSEIWQDLFFNSEKLFIIIIIIVIVNTKRFLLLLNGNKFFCSTCVLLLLGFHLGPHMSYPSHYFQLIINLILFPIPTVKIYCIFWSSTLFSCFYIYLIYMLFATIWFWAF